MRKIMEVQETMKRTRRLRSLLEHLVRCCDSEREYEPHPGRRFVKRLVGGRWETVPAKQIV